MPHTRIGCGLGLLVWMAACSDSLQSMAPTAPTPPPPPTMNIVAGRVVDFQRNQAVPGVQLNWQSVVNASVTTTTTNAEGIYRVELPIAAVYSVSGDRGISGIVRVASAFYITDFLINSGSCPLWYGFVTDARTGQPVSGARVGWFGVGSTTSALGEYRLFQPCRQPIPPGMFPGVGTVLLVIDHPAYRQFSVIGGRAESIGFGQGETRRDYALTPR